MPLLHFVFESDDRIEYLYTEMTKTKAQVGANKSLIEEDKGEPSDLEASQSNYEKLPDYIKSCLDYCYVVSIEDCVEKKMIIRLLIAENLIPEKPGEIVEDIAANILKELLVLGMIEETFNGYIDYIVLSEMYKKLCLFKVQQDFVINEVKNSPVYAVIHCKNGKHLPADNLKSFSVRSLFVTAPFDCDFYFNGAFLETICAFQFMVVLNLGRRFEYLPDEVRGLVNLRYLGLFGSKIKELPSSIGNLQKLQTLDISFPELRQLPVEILNIKQLRHLLMVGYPWSGFLRVPKGIGSLVNLHTWDGVRCGPGIAIELSKLCQLRKLGVQHVSEDYAEELFAAIAKMEKLVSLSLTAERLLDTTDEIIHLLPDLESFSPPPHLQELQLKGGLLQIPNWLSSMEDLTNLDLHDSNLRENPSSVLQFLPKLKRLTLLEAYKAKCIGKEFCYAGGFPLLECLTICSPDLVEWTEIVDGAFPNLRCLQFLYCIKLRFVPEGLQYITTIEELYFSVLHGDLARRLNGEENYKIKHISKFIVEGEC